MTTIVARQIRRWARIHEGECFVIQDGLLYVDEARRVSFWRRWRGGLRLGGIFDFIRRFLSEEKITNEQPDRLIEDLIQLRTQLRRIKRRYHRKSHPLLRWLFDSHVNTSYTSLIAQINWTLVILAKQEVKNFNNWLLEEKKAWVDGAYAKWKREHEVLDREFGVSASEAAAGEQFVEEISDWIALTLKTSSGIASLMEGKRELEDTGLSCTSAHYELMTKISNLNSLVDNERYLISRAMGSWQKARQSCLVGLEKKGDTSLIFPLEGKDLTEVKRLEIKREKVDLELVNTLGPRFEEMAAEMKRMIHRLDGALVTDGYLTEHFAA